MAALRADSSGRRNTLTHRLTASIHSDTISTVRVEYREATRAIRAAGGQLLPSVVILVSDSGTGRQSTRRGCKLPRHDGKPHSDGRLKVTRPAVGLSCHQTAVEDVGSGPLLLTALGTRFQPHRNTPTEEGSSFGPGWPPRWRHLSHRQDAPGSVDRAHLMSAALLARDSVRMRFG